MEEELSHKHHLGFTLKILVGMALGIMVGLGIKWLPLPPSVQEFLVNDIFTTGGKIFIIILKMLVVPIVFVSLVCGSSALGDIS